MKFSSTFIALQREAAIASEMLSSGITSLRKANISQLGYYNKAFFEITIGLERFGKLIYMVDYYLKNSFKFPNDSELRKFSHNIEELFKEINKIGVKRVGKEFVFPDSEIHQDIISFLSDFALKTRYHNLDYLAGGKTDPTEDPIFYWRQNIGTQILKKYKKGSKKSGNEEIEKQLIDKMEEVSFVRFTSESHESITSLRDLYTNTKDAELIHKYGCRYILQIARALTEIISSISHEAFVNGCEDIPYLIEFFAHFNNSDSYFLQRKTWSIYNV